MRNPSPPPLTEEEKEKLNADYIDDTIFSKKFALQILMKLYQHDDKEIYLNEKETENEELTLHKKELREKFETELCEFWDMSANERVAMFIYQNDGKDILLNVLDKTLSPRLMEIIFGIIGNLVCIKIICRDMSSDENFRSSMLSYLKITDALSLVELSRILLACLSNSEFKALWMEDFVNYFHDMVYILQNSLNVDLLENTMNIIYNIYDSDEKSIDNVNNDLINAIKSSYNELKLAKKLNGIVILIRLLQLISTTNKGVQTLAQNGSICEFLCEYIIEDKRTFGIEDTIDLYSSLCSLFTCLLSIKPCEVFKILNKQSSVLQYVIDTFYMHFKEVKYEQQPALGDSAMQSQTVIYFSNFLEFIADLCETLTKTNTYVIVGNIVKCMKKNEEKLHKVFIENKNLKFFNDNEELLLNFNKQFLNLMTVKTQ